MSSRRCSAPRRGSARRCWRRSTSVGDGEGCRRGDDGRVTTPTGFKEAYRRYVEGGWIGVSVPPDYGGLGLPVAISQLISEFMVSANLAFAMYPTLTQGAIAALIAHGSPEQKALYVPRLATGEWTGTMNLTEAHCGTDLGLIRTKAARQADGSYRITGTKIFISAGEHDLATNIVHLVLARIDGAPAGHPRPVAVRGAEDLARARRLARRAQCGLVRRDRAQDGHPRQRHLRDGLRRRDRLARRRGEPRAPRHVHDDERGAARRRPGRARACPRSPTRTPSHTRRTGCRAGR